MFALLPVMYESAVRGPGKVTADLQAYLSELNLLSRLLHNVARPILTALLVIWTSTGVLIAVSVTSRKWFYNVALIIISFAFLAVLRLLTLSGSLSQPSSIALLKDMLGAAILALSLLPLLWVGIRGLADRKVILALFALVLAATLIVFFTSPSSARPNEMLTLSLYMLAFAPLGLLPIGVAWGRTL